MKVTRNVKILVNKKVDSEEYKQQYKEFVVLMKDILLEIKRNKTDI